MEGSNTQTAGGLERQILVPECFQRLSWSGTGVVLLALAACWIGAGSVGLLASALRHALLAVLLGGMVLLSWPHRSKPAFSNTAWPKSVWAKGAGVALMAALFVFDSHPVLNVLGVVIILAGLAALQEGRNRAVWTGLCWAGLCLAAHRLALLTIPTYWHLADWVGFWLGWLGGALAGHPLEVGATFAGLDFLVLTKAWCVAWGVQRGGNRVGWALGLAIALLIGHLVYLAVLSWAPILREHLPPAPPRPESPVYIPPPWSWSDAVRSLLPWNLPWLAMGIHLTILGVALRWSCWSMRNEPQETFSDPGLKPGVRSEKKAAVPLQEIVLEAGPVVLAVVWPMLTLFWATPGRLSEKKILAYVANAQEWTRPAPDRFARADIGRFGMLPELVVGLRGRWIFSSQLAEKELQQADVVLLAGEPGPIPQGTVEALQNYVESGGALLAACAWPGHASSDGSSSSDGQGVSLGEMLAAWGVQLQSETAVPALGEWWEGLQPLSHPASLDSLGRSGFHRGACVGLSGSASLGIRWPAAPVLVGLWGYGDPGREAARNDFLPQYEPGERLGDLVFAAEIRRGKGRVLVLAAPDCLRNDLLPGAYIWVARMLSYLAHRGAGPLDAWRQVLSLAAAFALLGWIACRPQAAPLGIAAGVLGLMLLAGWWNREHSSRVLPDTQTVSQRVLSGSTRADSGGIANPASGGVLAGESASSGLRAPQGLPLAYIDASHMEPYSLHTWSPEGLGRLWITLMQAGYLPLLAPELSAERLQTAAVWISIAPARKFSSTERAALNEYVQNGGIFIAMAGAEDANALRPLLGNWNIRIGRSPVGPGEAEAEAEPIGQSPGPGEDLDQYGRLRTYYLNAKHYGRGDYMVAVTLYAPWPVESESPDTDVLVRGYEDTPIVVHRRIGGGGVVVIGDTYFAVNKNFDEMDGLPSATLIENAHFWRWMLSRVGRREEWIPPDPAQWEEQLPPEEFPAEGGPFQERSPARGARRSRDVE